MSTNKLLGIILLVVGGILVFFGLNATESIGEEVLEGVTGSYSDQTMWYLIGGAVSAVVGLVLLLKK